MYICCIFENVTFQQFLFGEELLLAIRKTKSESNAFFLFSWGFLGAVDHQMT